MKHIRCYSSIMMFQCALLPNLFAHYEGQRILIRILDSALQINSSWRFIIEYESITRYSLGSPNEYRITLYVIRIIVDASGLFETRIGVGAIQSRILLKSRILLIPDFTQFLQKLTDFGPDFDHSGFRTTRIGVGACKIPDFKNPTPRVRSRIHQLR